MKKDNSLASQSNAPTIDALVGQELPVLDHGFVRLVDYMGSDEAIVQAARVSYGKGTKKTSEDRGLIRYLMKHHHSTPFEMCEIKLHVKLPIFVARQWVRHRTANINEYSARYSILDKEFYVPDRTYLTEAIKESRAIAKKEARKKAGQDDLFGVEQPKIVEILATAKQSETNKQGRDKTLDEDEARGHLETIAQTSNRAYRAYEKLLNQTPDGSVLDPDRDGLARELARMVLPTNYYTQWYWKIDLHNLLNFIALRADSHAQFEIQEYARAILNIIKVWVPVTYEAFIDYRQSATVFSRLELNLLKNMLEGTKVGQADSGLTLREWREFQVKLGNAAPGA